MPPCRPCVPRASQSLPAPLRNAPWLRRLGLSVLFTAALSVLAASTDGVVTHPVPNPLLRADGSPIATAAEWSGQQRDALLSRFEREIYGRTPTTAVPMTADVREDVVLEGGALRRKQVRLTFRSEEGIATAELLILAPGRSTGPVPIFLGLNSGGNWTISQDPGIAAPAGHKRGRHERRWPVDFIVQQGYAVATLCCDDFFPDKNIESYPQSMQRLFPADQRGPGADQWGAIATWAWGLSRALDYLASDPLLDSARVAVIGHSRLGKAALWAGARDARFALVIANNSGCGGAALSKRIAGETVRDINSRFPHWFCGNFRAYNDREAKLPVDQHQLIALIAPRAIAVGSASDDAWADPLGERMALELAQPVFALFGIPSLDAPHPGDRQRLHYHLRPGEHDILLPDWQAYVRFADRVYGRIRD
ncbi:MAG: acetylxylan esterase [Opitutaceae bacterium]|nr:acetylxylan esterase [Opitutaceae bacterium]